MAMEKQEPTEQAKALHGDEARQEQYDQPEAVALDSDTLIAKDEDAGDQDDDSL